MEEQSLGKRAKAADGKKFERLALQYLNKQGLSLIDRNFCCRTGEIDLVMRDSDVLVFVEVRYRSRSDYGSALESITETKIKRIISASKSYLSKHNLWENIVRFDAIAIHPRGSKWIKKYNIEWIKSAFEA